MLFLLSRKISFTFIFILFLIILFKIKYNFLNRIIYHSTSFIGLVYRKFICGWIHLHTESLSPLLRHIEIGVSHVALNLFNSDQFPIVFELAHHVKPLWRLDWLLLLLFLLHIFFSGLFQSHVLERRMHFILTLGGFKYSHSMLDTTNGLLFPLHQPP